MQCSSSACISHSNGNSLLYFPPQKLKIRKIGLEEAAQVHQWNAVHKQLLKKLMTIDYMSSESSVDESDEENGAGVKRSVITVKKITWLKKKYRDAFHKIDSTYYNTHKRSRDKLKKRIQGVNSTRPQPEGSRGPKFAVKSEFRESSVHDNSVSGDSGLNTSTDSTLE